MKAKPAEQSHFFLRNLLHCICLLAIRLLTQRMQNSRSDRGASKKKTKKERVKGKTAPRAHAHKQTWSTTGSYSIT